jgi:hypothetical protein
MNRAAKGGLIDVLINSGELYRSLGGYPSSMHGTPSCCDAIQAEMKLGHTVAKVFQMTEAELIQISRDFKRMIEAIPKTRVREHLPTINQISRLLGRLGSEMYQTPRTPDVSGGVKSGDD